MSVKQRLEYGIFPIASRRHQPRDNWGSLQKFDHEYTREESQAIVWSWILTIPAIFVAMAVTGRSLIECFVYVIIIDLMIWWAMKHD